MARKRWIVIGVLVLALVCVGLSVLRWGEMVYWRSGGERGWSLGAAAYRLFGWGGAEEYQADMGWRGGGEEPEGVQPPRFEHRGAFEPGRRMPFGPGHVTLFGPARLFGGLACLALPLLLLGLGFVFWRRRQWNRRTASSCPQPPASAAQSGQ